MVTFLFTIYLIIIFFLKKLITYIYIGKKDFIYEKTNVWNKVSFYNSKS